MTCSLLASVLFFLVTNFGCWLWFDLYEHSVSGLVHCYAQALPFFRYTLAGDLVFASACSEATPSRSSGLPARRPSPCSPAVSRRFPGSKQKKR